MASPLGQTLADVLTHGTGTERAFLCPAHGDSRPSASVNVLKGLWLCYTCGARGNLDGAANQVDRLSIVEELLRQARRPPPTSYTESWLNLYDAGEIHPYWRGRFADVAIKHFRLGYDHHKHAVTYPMRTSSGRVLGVVRRPLDTDGGPKYLYPYGVNVGEYLFNYSTDARKKIFLVEGAMDAVACWEVGIEAFAIYGARISEHQVKLLSRLEAVEVVCVFDQDNAGLSAFHQVVEAMPRHIVTRVEWSRDLGKDIAELQPKTRLDLLGGWLGNYREELVGSDVCESPAYSPTLRVTNPARPPSRPTSRLVIVKSVPTRPPKRPKLD